MPSPSLATQHVSVAVIVEVGGDDDIRARGEVKSQRRRAVPKAAAAAVAEPRAVGGGPIAGEHVHGAGQRQVNCCDAQHKLPVSGDDANRLLDKAEAAPEMISITCPMI